MYKAVLYCFKKSGTHESDFIKFCDGKLVACYLRQHLKLKLGRNETVRASLPEHCLIESDKPVPCKPPPVPPSSTSSSSKKPKSNNHNFMENISDTITNLTYLLQHGGEEEKDLSQKRYELLLKDDERKDVKSTMFQYEEVMGLMQTNRNQLSNASDADYVAMLQKDFQNLKKRKRDLGSKLGLC